MNWESEAKYKLGKYLKCINAIESIPREIKALELQMGSIRSTTSDSESVRSSGGRSEDMMLSNIVERQELKNALEIAKLSVRNVESALNLLDDEERMLLSRFYINPDGYRTAELLQEEMCCDRATVYRKLRHAVRDFTMAMYGVTES